MTLKDEDSGRTVEVHPGSTVTIRLNEGTTGYRWAVENADGLQQIGDRNEPGGAVGSTGVRVIEFRASSPGSHNLKLKNWREFEGDSSVIGRFTVRVNVK